MATPPWDIQTASEEWLLELCDKVEEENGRIGGHQYGDRVVKLSDEIAVKYGHGVKDSEARTQEFAHRSVNPGIVHVPRVHRFFLRKNPSWHCPGGYLFMEYVPGKLLQDLDLNIKGDIVPKVAKIIKHLGQIQDSCHVLRTGVYIASSPPLGHHHSYIYLHKDHISTSTACPGRDNSQPVPGPIGGGEPEGYFFGDDGARRSFASVADFEAWLNTRLALRNKSIDLSSQPLVLCHMDLCRRNMILEENDSICLLDWGCAGMYPRYFEIATLSWLNPYDEPYEKPLLQATTALLGLTAKEKDSIALLEIARAANLRYSL
jgi:thiamine kinase-like enzyme